MSQPRKKPQPQILGRVNRDEFVGRARELDRLTAHGMQSGQTSGLLILATPFAGVSELLRQTFDLTFRSEEVCPIYFELPQGETTVVSAAIEFLNTFLLQYIAWRRHEPDLCHASLTLNDLREAAPSSDGEWIDELIDAYNKHRFGEDDREFVRFCLNGFRRIPADFRPFVMFNAEALPNFEDDQLLLAREIPRALAASGNSYVLSGLRRDLLDTMQRANREFQSFTLMKMEALKVDDARALINSVADRNQVAINDETRDLLAQQLECSPHFITTFIQAAQERQLPLDSYFACEQLYVDELLGGKPYRQFSVAFENMVFQPEIRSTLIRLLCEAAPTSKRTVAVESWRKALHMVGDTERLLRLLHVNELINWNGETLSLESGSVIWKDFLRARFRLDALREPRALVVADLMADALKRAPQTIARYYRRVSALSLRELLTEFDGQAVPRKLLQYDEFAPLYKGATPEEIAVGLETDADQLRLPQVFHTASGASFSTTLRPFGEENVAVAHAFEGATYTEQDEVVWLVAKVESKLEAGVTIVERWLNLLEDLALQSGFVKTQMWLIANEGFTAEASGLLRDHSAFGSSRQQFNLLSNRLNVAPTAPGSADSGDEFVLVLPMGDDNELLAATTVEQIARRLEFTPAAINQIKTAVVEACINAVEHSLSPDRKIYQRFRVENDKLVITISSRGVLPTSDTGDESQRATESEADLARDRRGWGLKLIKTLMDEVEFERVDEGTSLRMTKYLRRTATAESHNAS